MSRLKYQQMKAVVVLIMVAIVILADTNRHRMNLFENTDSFVDQVEKSSNVTSKLFPPALDMMRRGIAFENVYRCFDESNSFSLIEAQKKRKPPLAGLEHVNIDEEIKFIQANNITTCSCEVNATKSKLSPLCCQRRVFSGHKMGTFLQMSLEDKFKEHSIEKADFDEFPNGRDIPYIKDHLLQPVIDYRDVIILRNIYDSLISGYLYHKSGRECWLDWWGQQGWDPNLFPSYHTKRWMRYIDLSSQKTKIYDTLCHCLSNSTEEDGLRIYIDWVFHAFYAKTFQFWALSSSSSWSSCESIEKRVRTYCFEDLASKQTSSIESMIDFLTMTDSNSTRRLRDETQPEKQDYDGGHSTSHNKSLRRRLRAKIIAIDHEYYNDDIKWLHSVLPCK